MMSGVNARPFWAGTRQGAAQAMPMIQPISARGKITPRRKQRIVDVIARALPDEGG